MTKDDTYGLERSSDEHVVLDMERRGSHLYVVEGPHPFEMFPGDTMDLSFGGGPPMVLHCCWDHEPDRSSLRKRIHRAVGVLRGRV